MTRPDDLANPGMAGKRTDVSAKMKKIYESNFHQINFFSTG